MNAEALIGTVLGTCTLQQVIGQGGMGAVFLAQQSRPRRQVAVKVLLPITPLPPNQLTAFLERFRRETDAAASLEHPNIIPVYEYGEYNGLAYLVMPYISGGTLRDVMEHEGAIPLPKVLSYLEQLASALDFAHERGVIHRDIKPANVLLTPEGRVLLTDFGLVKVSIEGQEALIRLTGPGAPVGTPDYMSPEQVLGNPVDGRADLYSLGVILYQMVTGTTPFRGETPMQIAAQHLQVPPNSPRLLRPDLPPAAEQIMLRAMAKRPTDRYPRGQDLATAFRVALTTSDMQLQEAGFSADSTAGMRPFGSGGLFDPKWQTGSLSADLSKGKPAGLLPAAKPARTTGLLSAYRTAASPSPGTEPLSAEAMMGDSVLPTATGAQRVIPSRETDPKSSMLNDMVLPDPTGTGVQPAVFKTTTGALGVPNNEQANTIKLTGPVKVVQVPIAGQPGRYITGLLPVVQQPEPEPAHRGMSTPMKVVTLVITVLLVIGFGAGTFWFVHTHPAQTAKMQPTGTTAPVGVANPAATAAARATATASANILLTDPLSVHNIHNWPEGRTANAQYVFTDTAYHITNLGDGGAAATLNLSFSGPIVYTLTMQEIKGDDTSLNNSFGMIIRSNVQSKGGKIVSRFYSFEVVNTPGGEYRFYKYDDSNGASNSAWTELWHQTFGPEFHQGQGPKNTFKISANGSNFTFTVNGKPVGHTSDRAIASGGVGMLVNLKGTEVAFSNMLITRS